MQNLYYAAGIAFLIVLALGPALIPALRRLKFGQSIRQEGPPRHYAKAGTPTMGGLLILVGVTVPTAIFVGWDPEAVLALLITLGHGVIGFMDDFIKVVLKRNLGLTARQKLLGQLILASALVFAAVNYFGRGTVVWVPGWGITVDLGPFYYIVAVLFVIYTSNAVNLTDGLDGLAAGTMAIAALAYAIISLYYNQPSLALFSVAIAGAVLGFLRFNLHPARVFMGDTGSLALGGALATLAILTKTELLMVIIGGVFMLEGLSVIIQVAAFKSTGKRVFKMSPIHHHFELSGWTETKVVTVFWLAATIFAIVALSVIAVDRGGRYYGF
jgi:phospho-N-acetylmuramoyl-pentapeptide-transferase